MAYFGFSPIDEVVFKISVQTLLISLTEPCCFNVSNSVTRPLSLTILSKSEVLPESVNLLITFWVLWAISTIELNTSDILSAKVLKPSFINVSRASLAVANDFSYSSATVAKASLSIINLPYNSCPASVVKSNPANKSLNPSLDVGNATPNLLKLCINTFVL